MAPGRPDLDAEGVVVLEISGGNPARNSIVRTLSLVDQNDVCLVTTGQLFFDLCQVRRLQQANVIVDIDREVPCEDVWMNGTFVQSAESVTEKLGRGEVNRVVFVTFSRLEQMIVGFLKRFQLPSVQFFAPSRTSAIDRLYGEFGGELTLIKGLDLVPLQRQLTRARDPVDTCDQSRSNADLKATRSDKANCGI